MPSEHQMKGDQFEELQVEIGSDGACDSVRASPVQQISISWRSNTGAETCAPWVSDLALRVWLGGWVVLPHRRTPGLVPGRRR